MVVGLWAVPAALGIGRARVEAHEGFVALYPTRFRIIDLKDV